MPHGQLKSVFSESLSHQGNSASSSSSNSGSAAAAHAHKHTSTQTLNGRSEELDGDTQYLSLSHTHKIHTHARTQPHPQTTTNTLSVRTEPVPQCTEVQHDLPHILVVLDANHLGQHALVDLQQSGAVHTFGTEFLLAGGTHHTSHGRRVHECTHTSSYSQLISEMKIKTQQ